MVKKLKESPSILLVCLENLQQTKYFHIWRFSPQSNK